MDILSSASKLVFLGVATTVCLVFIYEVVKGIAVLESKEFMFLAGSAFTYYFTRDKGELIPNTTSVTTTKIETPPVDNSSQV